MGKFIRKVRLRGALIAALSFLLICSVFGSVILAGLSGGISVGNAEESEETSGNYFYSDYDTRSEVIDASNDLNEEIYGEGVVLLKNEGDSLPLAEGARISVFGKNSANIIQAGSGAGGSTSGVSVSLSSALTTAGFSLNPTLVNFYSNNTASGSGRGTAPTNGATSPGYNTGETPVDMYTDEVKSSFSNYNDAAIVVISRISGEGFDLPRTMMYNGSSYATWGTDVNQIVPGARNMDDHYLQLDQNETDLIQMCGEYFDKVIVLLNVGSTFELGFLDDPGHYAYNANVKAALWIGYPGGTGLTALAEVLKGEINPSGRTMDTFSRDFKTEPSWYNFGNYLMEGTTDTKGNQYTNLPSGSLGDGDSSINYTVGGYFNNYVTYNEGIYVGYRYWETRGYDEGTETWTASTDANDSANYLHGTTTTTWDSWYEGHVVYPLGYGLSYTTFEQKIVSSTPSGGTLSRDGTVTFEVEVTNTGDVAGKEVVQLYYTAPYIEGGIEKAHVVLGAFAKTGLLDPDESQTLELTINVQDMASYDWNDANGNDHKGYELDAGTYEVRLMSNAHEEIDSVSYTVPEGGYQYGTDGTTGNTVENRFDEVSEYIEDETSGYMTRADWEGTFPEMNSRLTADQWIIDGLYEWSNKTDGFDESDEPYYAATAPTTGASNGLLLTDLVGVAYDDELWDDFLDQLTYSQLQQLAMQGSYYSGIDAPELGITRGRNRDGTGGFSLSGATFNSWCSETVLASTWNVELAYAKGRAMGNQALWGNGSESIFGWYAPAVNIHRSPFGGRNFEYYSEDGYLTGMMSAYVVRGAQDKGLFTYVKHFGVNDQETNRCGLMTWLNEQSMREIYIKPFEICVKVGGTMGIMSSLNRIGYEWAGGSYELLTEILRNEWGFEGCVVTDYYINNLMNADQMIRAGGNLALGNASLSYNLTSATTVTALRNAAHGLLYAHANSLAMNTLSEPVPPTAISSFLGGSMVRGTVGIAYEGSVATATINTSLYPGVDDSAIVYTLAEGSALPDGLTLSSSGTVSGTPTSEVSNFSFTVNATYADYTTSAVFTITIASADTSIIYEATTDLSYVYIGEEVEISVASASIYGPFDTEEDIAKYPNISYSLKNGSLLPAGLTFSSEGIISGTPLYACQSYEFTVVASAFGLRDAEVTFTISVYNRMTFTGTELTNGKYGVSYVQNIATAETANAVTYTLKDGSTLPNGLQLTQGGHIVGIPLETVTSHIFTVVATADYALPQEAEFTITVGIAFNEFTLPHGLQGTSYSTRIDTAQGAGTITYALTGGELPEGLTLSEDGILSGTPTEGGTYTLTFTASAEGKASDEITVTLYIEGTGSAGNLGGVAIALIVVGAVVLAGAAAGLTVFFVRRGKKNNGETKGD